MNGIEIFIDESGDFGKYEAHCPYYVVTMVFHESVDHLYGQLEAQEYSLDVLNLADHCIHSSPAIRGEDEYFGMPLPLRRKVLLNLMAFIHNADFRFKCFFVKKDPAMSEVELFAALKESIDPFITANFSKLASYSKIAIAYDRGQKQISQLISQTLEALFKTTGNPLELFFRSSRTHLGFLRYHRGVPLGWCHRLRDDFWMS